MLCDVHICGYRTMFDENPRWFSRSWIWKHAVIINSSIRRMQVILIWLYFAFYFRTPKCIFYCFFRLDVNNVGFHQISCIRLPAVYPQYIVICLQTNHTSKNHIMPIWEKWNYQDNLKTLTLEILLWIYVIFPNCLHIILLLCSFIFSSFARYF